MRLYDRFVQYSHHKLEIIIIINLFSVKNEHTDILNK